MASDSSCMPGASPLALAFPGRGFLVLSVCWPHLPVPLLGLASLPAWHDECGQL